MLVIRLNRTGRKNKPYFRLAVQEKTAAPGGRHAELVGSWDPHKKQGVFRAERIQYWMSVGAQPSDTVWNLLVKQGIIKGKKRPVKMKGQSASGTLPISPEDKQIVSGEQKAENDTPQAADDMKTGGGEQQKQEEEKEST